MRNAKPTRPIGRPLHEMNDGELARKRQVAEWLGCTERNVERMVAAGQLPEPVRIGGMVRFLVGDLRRRVAAQ